MNQGVEILLKRMDSHPEEFGVELDHRKAWAHNASKWTGVVNEIVSRMGHIDPTNIVGQPTAALPPLPYLTDDEVKLLYAKLMLIQGDSFTKQVMEILLADEQNKETDYATSATPMTASNTMLLNAGIGISTTGVIGDSII